MFGRTLASFGMGFVFGISRRATRVPLLFSTTVVLVDFLQISVTSFVFYMKTICNATKLR